MIDITVLSKKSITSAFPVLNVSREISSITLALISKVTFAEVRL